MKRSVSRASKLSVDAQDPPENFFPGIPDSKWHEFLEKEDTDSFILGIREEILSKCIEKCFEKYLEKQAVAFTVQCAYLAWCKVINVYYMFRDPADMDDPKAKESWEPDPEPEPSIVDSWGSKCMKPMTPKKPEKEREKASVVYDGPSSEQICVSSSPEASSFITDFFDFGEAGFFYPFAFAPSIASEFSHKKSIFTRTLSMSRGSLPLHDPVVSGKDLCHPNKTTNSTLRKRTNSHKKESYV